jgi:hypothetical protein
MGKAFGGGGTAKRDQFPVTRTQRAPVRGSPRESAFTFIRTRIPVSGVILIQDDVEHDPPLRQSLRRFPPLECLGPSEQSGLYVPTDDGMRLLGPDPSGGLENVDRDRLILSKRPSDAQCSVVHKLASEFVVWTPSQSPLGVFALIFMPSRSMLCGSFSGRRPFSCRAPPGYRAFPEFLQLCLRTSRSK